MISLEKGMILTPLQKLPNNVSYLDKIIVTTTGFECLPNKHKIAQSGHTVWRSLTIIISVTRLDYRWKVLATIFCTKSSPTIWWFSGYFENVSCKAKTDYENLGQFLFQHLVTLIIVLLTFKNKPRTLWEALDISLLSISPLDKQKLLASRERWLGGYFRARCMIVRMSVTRLGDLLDFGKLYKAFGSN